MILFFIIKSFIFVIKEYNERLVNIAVLLICSINLIIIDKNYSYYHPRESLPKAIIILKDYYQRQ